MDTSEINPFSVGDEVRFTNTAKHEKMPEWYPAVGTVGLITLVPKFGPDPEFGYTLTIQWPINTIKIRGYCSTCYSSDVELVKS